MVFPPAALAGGSPLFAALFAAPPFPAVSSMEDIDVKDMSLFVVAKTQVVAAVYIMNKNNNTLFCLVGNSSSIFDFLYIILSFVWNVVCMYVCSVFLSCLQE